MLTKLPIELIRGNGLPNMLVTNVGSSLDVSSLPALPGVTVNSISYDKQAGVMTIILSNGESLYVRGFVRATDLRRGADGTPGNTGLNGVNGINGVDGKTGATGPRGYQGLSGIQGLPGPKGLTGHVGDIGYSGVGGDQGIQGPIGKQGPQGPQGPVGNDGRKGYLPITVADSDPGAIGAGSMWVKPSGFVYSSDKVNFTVTGSVQDILCQDTLNLLSIVNSGNPIPDWWTTKSISSQGLTTIVASYRAAALMGSHLALVADYASVMGNVTCVTAKKFINLGLQLVDPKCYAELDTLYIFDQNTLYTISDSFSTSKTDVDDVNDIIIHDNILYISSSTGFYSYDLNFKKLIKHSSINCLYSIMYADWFYLVSDAQTQKTDLKNSESSLSGRAIVSNDGALVIMDTSDGISINSLDGSLLWHNSNFKYYKDNLITNGSSFYSIGISGPRFIVDSPYSVFADENWLIEYDDVIHVTENR